MAYVKGGRENTKKCKKNLLEIIGTDIDSTLNQEPVTIFIRSPSACKDMKRFR